MQNHFVISSFRYLKTGKSCSWRQIALHFMRHIICYTGDKVAELGLVRSWLKPMILRDWNFFVLVWVAGIFELQSTKSVPWIRSFCDSSTFLSKYTCYFGCYLKIVSVKYVCICSVSVFIDEIEAVTLIRIRLSTLDDTGDDKHIKNTVPYWW